MHNLNNVALCLRLKNLKSVYRTVLAYRNFGTGRFRRETAYRTPRPRSPNFCFSSTLFAFRALLGTVFQMRRFTIAFGFQTDPAPSPVALHAFSRTFCVLCHLSVMCISCFRRAGTFRCNRGHRVYGDLLFVDKWWRRIACICSTDRLAVTFDNHGQIEKRTARAEY